MRKNTKQKLNLLANSLHKLSHDNIQSLILLTCREISKTKEGFGTKCLTCLFTFVRNLTVRRGYDACAKRQRLREWLAQDWLTGRESSETKRTHSSSYEREKERAALWMNEWARKKISSKQFRRAERANDREVGSFWGSFVYEMRTKYSIIFS